ncbi:UNVERIFIED_CONTAM: hypothetical protein NCL1_03661 [Trichonephila clavipes]
MGSPADPRAAGACQPGPRHFPAGLGLQRTGGLEAAAGRQRGGQPGPACRRASPAVRCLDLAGHRCRSGRGLVAARPALAGSADRAGGCRASGGDRSPGAVAGAGRADGCGPAGA